jgi:hypothetical protein
MVIIITIKKRQTLFVFYFVRKTDKKITFLCAIIKSLDA